jgi:hypothetical protein
MVRRLRPRLESSNPLAVRLVGNGRKVGTVNDELRETLSEIIADMRGVTIELVDVLTTKQWLTWEPEDRQLLRKFVRSGVMLFNNSVRPPFDKAIYEAHDAGKLPTSFKPIRTRNVYEDGKSPGRKAPTAAQKVDKLLAEDDESETEVEVND